MKISPTFDFFFSDLDKFMHTRFPLKILSIYGFLEHERSEIRTVQWGLNKFLSGSPTLTVLSG